MYILPVSATMFGIGDMNKTYDILEHGIVVSVLHQRTVPVDKTASPVNGTLSVRGQTSRPQRQLDASRCLWVVILFVGRVVRVALLESPHCISVNRPGDRVWRPINLVRVNILLSI